MAMILYVENKRELHCIKATKFEKKRAKKINKYK